MATQHATLIEAANAAGPVADYETALFGALVRWIGFEVAFCLRSGSLGPQQQADALGLAAVTTPAASRAVVSRNK